MIATDMLSLVFICCFLFGLLYLLFTAFMGGIGSEHAHHGHHLGHDVQHFHGGGHHGHAASVHHGHHGGDVHQDGGGGDGPDFSLLSVFNPTSIIFFLIGFGFFGYVFYNTASLALPLTLILAVVSGVVVAFLLLALLARLFGNIAPTTVQDVSDRTGLLGKVSITIQEYGIGEIIYVSPGKMRKSIPARSVDGRRLERDQEVVVVNFQKGVAEVDTWDHFVNQDPSHNSLPAMSDDLATLRSLLEEPDKQTSEYVSRNETQKE